MSDQAPCVVCGSTSKRAFVVELRSGKISTCPDCSSGLLDPRPSAVDLGALHSSDDYFNHPYFEARRELTPPQRASAAARLSHIQRHIGSLKGKRLLDVGCDTGLFVEYAAKAHSVEASGVDIFPRVVRIGRDAGRDLYAGTLESLQLPDASLDVLTAFDLIEHVDDPRRFVREAVRVLRPGGILALETPNYNGLIYRIGRLLGHVYGVAMALAPLQERLWPPFHVQYFTMSSLGRMVEEAGFEAVEISGRELGRGELAVQFPLLRAAVLSVFFVSQAVGQNTLISAVLRRPAGAAQRKGS